MYIDLFQSIGHSHVSHIFLYRIVTVFVPSSPVTFINSGGISFILGDFPLEIFFMAFATSASVIVGFCTNGVAVNTSLIVSFFLYSSCVHSFHLSLMPFCDNFCFLVFQNTWFGGLFYCDFFYYLVENFGILIVFLYYIALVLQIGFLVASCLVLKLCIELLM